MPIVAKVSLATALPTVRGLVGDLGRTVRDLGPLPGIDPVTNGIASLDAWCGGKGLDVDVVVVSPLEVEEAGKVGAWIGKGFPVAVLARAGQSAVADLPSGEGLLALKVNAKPLAAMGGVTAGTPRAPVLVAVIGSASALHPEAMAALENLIEDRPRAILIGPPSDSAVKLVEARAQDLAWTSTLLDPTAMPGVALQRALGTPPWDGVHELFRAHSAAGALETLTEVFDLVIDQQLRDIKVKRSVAQAKLGKPAGPAGRPAIVTGSGTNEILVEVKTRIQRHAQEFERGAAERLADLLSPTSGALYRETEGMLLSLDKLTEEPRSTKIETRLPTDFLERLIRTVREQIARHCSGDVVAVNDLFRLLSQEIERTLQANDGPPFVAHFSFLTEERVRRMLDMSAVIQVQYRGEMPKRGFGEYFAAVRKYSMLLVMAASMFGLSQFMRQYREYMIPATILLVLFGSYSVASSTQQQRVEAIEKELEAARNALRPDLKRIFTDVQKSWMAVISGHMSEQINSVLGVVDEATRDFQARKGAEVNPEKERMQRQIAQLDLFEKRLGVPQKARDALVATIGQIKGELRGLMPRPGAPAGVPGKPGLPGAAPGGPGAAASAAAAAAQAKIAALKAPGPPGAAPGGPLAAMQAKMAALKAPAEGAAPAPAAAKPVNPFAEKLAAMKAKKSGEDAPGAVASPASPAAAVAAVAAVAGGSVQAASVPEPNSAAPAKPVNPFAEKLAAMKAKKAAESAPAPAEAATPAAAPVPEAAASATPEAAAAFVNPFADKLAAMKAQSEARKAAKAAAPSMKVAPAAAAPEAATPAVTSAPAAVPAPEPPSAAVAPSPAPPAAPTPGVAPPVAPAPEAASPPATPPVVLAPAPTVAAASTALPPALAEPSPPPVVALPIAAAAEAAPPVAPAPAVASPVMPAPAPTPALAAAPTAAPPAVAAPSPAPVVALPLAAAPEEAPPSPMPTVATTEAESVVGAPEVVLVERPTPEAAPKPEQA